MPSPHDADTMPDWNLVRLAEASRKPLEERVASELARGQRDYQPPEVGDLVSANVRKVQEDERNRARLERFSDYIVPGEAIVEVGCGAGFVAARVLAAGAGSYRAMDLEASCVRRTTRLLDALGLQDRVGPIVEKDLYTLAPGDLEDASLVLCSEVIEHVPDPEGALETLAAALPEGTDLLFSVPLLGRLEQVWGHLSIFTADRLQDMLASAGLEALHVEPLADRWVIVLAGRAGTSERREDRITRVRAGAQQHPDVSSEGEIESVPAQPTRFDNVTIDTVPLVPLEHSPTAQVVASAADSDTGAITAQVTAPRSLLRRRESGGVGLSLAGVEPVQGVRLQLVVDSLDEVTEITVAFTGPDVSEPAVWTWRPSLRDRRNNRPRTVSFRPGPDRTPFTSPASADLAGAERVEVRVSVRAGRTARFEITRLAWIR